MALHVNTSFVIDQKILENGKRHISSTSGKCLAKFFTNHSISLPDDSQMSISPVIFSINPRNSIIPTNLPLFKIPVLPLYDETTPHANGTSITFWSRTDFVIYALTTCAKHVRVSGLALQHERVLLTNHQQMTRPTLHVYHPQRL